MAEQDDLAALVTRLGRRLVEAEGPLLEGRGLSMWAYIVLSHLARQPAPTQLALASAVRYDKSRLIALLDDLERDGLITRTADPADRRSRIVQLTAAGRRLHAAARSDIRAMEEEMLIDLTSTERNTLRRVLASLAGKTMPTA